MISAHAEITNNWFLFTAKPCAKCIQDKSCIQCNRILTVCPYVHDIRRVS